MKHTVEEAARIEREKILQELKDGYSKHKDTSLYNAFAATIEKYAVPLFKDEAEWQSKQSPWISVKERLPEKDGYYFVTDGDVVEKVYFFERWNKFTSTRDYPHLFYDEGVIKAWLPIPSFDDILEANRDVLERKRERRKEIKHGSK